MALSGVLGNGSKVGYSVTSPVAYVKIAQLMDIPSFIALIANDIDTTVHSTSRVMTMMPGMIPVPEIQLMLLADLDPATAASHETLRAIQSSGVNYWWRVEVPVDRLQVNFRAWEFQGFVKEWTPAVKIADKQTLSVKIKYAGNLAVYNPAASVLG